MMNQDIGRSLAVLCLICGLWAAAVAGVPAVTPEVQTAQWAQSWWMARHKEKVEAVKQRQGEVDLLWIGDSITHGWENTGKAVWDEYYGKRKAFNIGFSGDRTEQVIWRLQHGEVEGISPKLAVMMIGTNNTGHRQDPAEETAAGVKAILDELKARLPKTKVLLLAIFPRGATPDDPLRKLNAEINEKLAKMDDGERVFYLDINSTFLERDGTLPRTVMPDLLHPNAEGYSMWARAIEPHVRRLMGERPLLGEARVIRLWPGTPPGKVTDKEESAETRGNVTRVANVSTPAMSLYTPGQGGNRPTVLVLPGGGYNILAIDLEGTEIAEWLNSIGYAAAVLKYRVPGNREGALMDAQRAMGLLRHNAKEWGLDARRMGVLGFSAGAHLAASLSNHYEKRNYDLVDDADRQACRPDFTVLVYPAYLADKDGALVAEIPVTEKTPPAFIVQTQDDRRLVGSSTAYFLGLSKVNVPAELHIFPAGGMAMACGPARILYRNGQSCAKCGWRT